MNGPAIKPPKPDFIPPLNFEELPHYVTTSEEEDDEPSECNNNDQQQRDENEEAKSTNQSHKIPINPQDNYNEAKQYVEDYYKKHVLM